MKTTQNTTEIRKAIKSGNCFVYQTTDDSDYLLLVAKFHPAINSDHVDLVETTDGELFTLNNVRIG